MSNEPQTVLLTGAFGNVGAQTIRALARSGYRVTAFDLRNEANENARAKAAREADFETIWGDLTDPEQVSAVVSGLRPQAILHVAAVIPPAAYVRPDIARAVNVDGTRHLIEAASALEVAPRFVFTSSYSVHGPRNPHRNLPRLDGSTPVNPGDSYGCHKVLCERMLHESDLPWTILRLGAVHPVELGTANDPETTKFTFLLEPEGRMHGIDVRDVASGLTNAISADCVGRTFDLAGGPGWEGTNRDLLGRIFGAMGLPLVPVSAFRMPDPEADDSWYFQDWVDTTEPQAVLDYQNHTVDDYLAAIRASGLQRAFMRLVGPLATKRLLAASPFEGKPREPDPTPMRDVILETWDMDPSEVDCS